MSKRTKADLILLIVTMSWGISYFLINQCLEVMGAFTLNAFRFGGAFLCIMLMTFPRFRKISKATWFYSLWIGIVLLIVYTTANYGVKYTSISNSGFLISLTVLFTPILCFFIKKQVPEKKLFLVCITCTIGVALMSLDSNFKIALGDLICIVCALCNSFYLILVEHAVRKEEVDVFQCGVLPLGFMGIFCTILAFILETPALPSDSQIWGYVLFLSLVCTGFALVAQSMAQQYTDASHVGVIYTLEPVFSSIVAFFLAGEVLLPRAYAGEVIMIVSMIALEVDLSPKVWYNTKLKCKRNDNR